MKYPDNVESVAALEPDFLGFIFYEKSARFFNGTIPKIPSKIKKVGVFVDAPFDYVYSMIQLHNLDLVQLHGGESPEYCAHFEDVEVIKVFSIKDTFNFERLKPFEKVCDYYLFDTKGELPGGNGYQFNWKTLEAYPSEKPYFLSGGIGLNALDTLQDFLNMPYAKHCYTIDVNSKFELQAGRKKIDELEKFKYELQR